MTLLWLGPDLPAASQLSASSKARKDVKRGKRCGALKRDDGINLNFDKDWMKGVKLVSKRLVDLEYYTKLGQTVPMLARYLEGHGVTLNHYVEKTRCWNLIQINASSFPWAVAMLLFRKCSSNAIIQQSRHTPGRQKPRSG
jgi:hypothetical protein